MSNVYGYDLEQCEECGGSGEVMKVECYGDMPMEICETCEACDGTGVKNES